MERRPLLADRAENSYIEGAEGPHPRIQRPTLRSSVSYDELPPSVVGYLGENYHCIITPPRNTRTEKTENNNESSSESSQYTREIIQQTRRRPIFIYLVSFVDLILLVYLCAAGGIETVGLKSSPEYKKVKEFGFIHLENSTAQESVGIIPGVNIFIGPNASFLIRMGALFSPCMRTDKLIVKSIEKRRTKEEQYGCCSFNGECGMMNKSSCSFPWQVIGNKTTCTPSNRKCRFGVTLRPCCIGIHTECEIMSKDKCDFVRGQWHKDKLLCSEVNCLDNICGMTGAEQTHGNQGYRLLTPIFLHIGILHLLANLIFQVIFGAKIEKDIGTVRTALIYLISGFGGNLVSGIFTPLLPEVGASGALFGFLALLLVWYVRYYSVLRKPLWDLCALVSIILISFAMGTLPYIGNFVHIGGFIFGLLTAIILLAPKKSNGLRPEHFWRDWILKGIAISLLITLTVAGFILLYSRDSDFCEACKYIDCINWTDNFCPSITHDGLLNTEDL